MTWLGCTRQCKKKLKIASYSEQIQILTLVPECTFQNILMSSHEIKKVGEILEKPAPKKGKTITTETLYLVKNTSEDDNFSR